MKQIYHPYNKWECYKNGMWRRESKEYELQMMDEVIDFTGNHILYGNAMLEVITKWKFSCENFLTNKSINRKAYIGHAACCFKHKYPEYLVRQAWGKLSEHQMRQANQKAESAIRQWEIHINNKIDNQLKIW